jgi:hypothetical protein
VSDYEFLAIGETLIKAATLSRFQVDFLGPLTPEGKAFFQGPPRTDVLRKQAERVFQGAFHSHRFSYRHRGASISAGEFLWKICDLLVT